MGPDSNKFQQFHLSYTIIAPIAQFLVAQMHACNNKFRQHFGFI